MYVNEMMTTQHDPRGFRILSVKQTKMHSALFMCLCLNVGIFKNYFGVDLFEILSYNNRASFTCWLAYILSYSDILNHATVTELSFSL